MRFSLREFSEVFKLRNAAGRPYVLIGGQAVNYWAERYLKSEPELERLLTRTRRFGGFASNNWKRGISTGLPKFHPEVARRTEVCWWGRPDSDGASMWHQQWNWGVRVIERD